MYPRDVVSFSERSRVYPVEYSLPPQKQQRRSCGEFFKKYFLQGQELDPDLQKKIVEVGGIQNLPFYERYRKYLALLYPFMFFQVCWWSLAIKHDIFSLYPTRYEMALTMIVGSFASGATSEGGGAIAFPVMTLLLHLDPTVARDFSLMIQSCGMTASAFTIMFMQVKVEWHSLIYTSMGSFISIILTLQYLDDLIDEAQKKMTFVAVWFAFAISLFILNTQKKRQTYDTIVDFGFWNGVILFITGLFGGSLSAWTGSGVDICSFSMLTLFFRVSEKVATPTSVVLMCVNTLTGFYWRHLIQDEISDLAWEYFAVSVPVAVTTSPLGALLSSHLHRQVLAFFIYILETLSVIGWLITRPSVMLIGVGSFIVVFAVIFFTLISKSGQHRANEIVKSKSNESLPNYYV
ncbi:unnamed protein product [Bursaphelenchus xylophilus]|uniref:(pine wood nematode) hypothetical protein n=1 Tax=Bursaphelenchus xylophilus TaxID=6326 RepID=A0A1I7S469_BURXY|nr:unnamed protein product [Bursaphelenchus xylophilus]CAG9116783.1 unnamed protein product [Bursaphelenchus xylophilus]